METMNKRCFSKQPNIIPRIKCDCGRYNNKPSKRAEVFATCRWCGVLISKKEDFKNKLLKEMKELK